MPELSHAERATVESIVMGVQRRNRRRRQAARSGWALLVTAAIALPVLASAMDDAITTTTALTRIGLALVLSMFVAYALGSLVDGYQADAALRSVESALMNARQAAEEAAAAVAADPTGPPDPTTDSPVERREQVTDASDDNQ